MDIIYRIDPTVPTLGSQPSDGNSALRLLCEGNERFADTGVKLRGRASGGSADDTVVIRVNPLAMGVTSGDEIPKQRPFALVLGCSDARVPLETIFAQAFNNLFVVRLAGNVLGLEAVGSIDYAARYLGDSVQCVVVLGHTGCGAVAAAVDIYLDPEGNSGIAHTHALRSVVDRIIIAPRRASRALFAATGKDQRNHPNYRAAMVETSVYLNAAIAAFDLRRQLTTDGHLKYKVAYGVYDLLTMRVRGMPDDTSSTLAEAPDEVEDFNALSLRVAKAAADRLLA